METQGASLKRTSLAPSWDAIPFAPLVKKTIAPALIGGICIGAWYAWHMTNPVMLPSWVFYLVLVALSALLIIGQTIWYLKTIDLPATQLVVVSGWTGIVMGVIAAIAYLYVDFSYLALFRLISEPIMTAIACVVVSWFVRKVGGRLLLAQ